VGFRPTLHRLAAELQLAGWVLNTTTGVICEVEGPEDQCREFFRRMHGEAPPLSRITASFMEMLPPVGFNDFSIRRSEEEEGEVTLISPDTAICADCARELLDPADRRYRYPFINCTNCGPRYSIIEALPYDRPHTTMSAFAMCQDCRREYEDPANRRYHAQPNACPVCGPQVWLSSREGGRLAERDEAIQQAVRMLAEGRILAVKGLGGFHLACDALNPEAVDELRRRKKRARFKPLAVMVKDFTVLRALADATEQELSLLASPISPIVLVDKRQDSPYTLAPMVAPRTSLLGVMVPYTPLHLLLFNTELERLTPTGADTLEVLVMTSANLAEEPLVYDNEEALERLAYLADAFLLHDRPIVAPSDDSIVRVMAGEPRVLRLGRGYAPYPVALCRDPREAAPEGCVVGWGPDLKATFALQAGRFALISPHLGDQETLPAQAFHRRSLEHFRRVFRQSPDAIAADLHPGYHSRRLALEEAQASGARFLDIQHHHAHLASVMQECGLEGEVIALTLDGTGFGTDETIWGGEILVGGLAGFARAGTLLQFPLPGGEEAIRETWRLALSLLNAASEELLSQTVAGLEQAPFRTEAEVVHAMLQRGINLVPCTSLGRLFDGFSALLGICLFATYEAQAAIELEGAAAAAPGETRLEMDLEEREGLLVVDWRPAVRGVLRELARARIQPLLLPEEFSPAQTELRLPDAVRRLARGFISALTRANAEAAHRVGRQRGLDRVVLSGGCFQNKLLLEGMVQELHTRGLGVFTHSSVPMNDAGVSLGQLAHGLARKRG